MSFTLILLFHYTRRSTIAVASEESLRDSEPPDIFLQGTRASSDRILHDIKLVLMSSHTAACCSSIVNLCLRGVHVLREALVI